MTISNIYYSTLVRIWDMGGEICFFRDKNYSQTTKLKIQIRHRINNQVKTLKYSHFPH